jgi:hypothetical protein
MVAEPTTTTYSDALITTFIETYPLMDERGEQPYTWSSATPPVQVANTGWVATYDLHAAAADIWDEKAATWADKYNFSADGGNYSRSNVYEQMMGRVRYHRARRSSKTMTLHQWPEETQGGEFSWIGNLAENQD